MPGIQPLLDPFWFVRKLESSIRVGYINFIKRMSILRFRKIKAMGRFVPDHAKPRFVFVRLTNPIGSHVGNDISVIAWHDLTITRDIKFGIEVFTLAFVSNESVKARPWVIVFFTHVPFAEISSLVSRVMKHTREILKILWILGEVIDNRMSVGVFTRKYGSPTRRAKRSRAEGIFKIHPTGCKLIDRWGLDMGMPCTPKAIPAKIIAKDEKHIGLLGLKICRKVKP